MKNRTLFQKTWMLGLALVLLGQSSGIRAKEFSYLLRSPKALLMGDAFTAIADDAYTLFYNPAALSRHRGLSVYFINPDVGVTNALSEIDKFRNFPSGDPAAIADRIVGIPLYLRLGATPGIKMESFGISLFAGVKTNLVLRDAVHPSLEIDYGLNRGVVAGYAYSVGSGARNLAGKKRRGGGTGGEGEKFTVAVGIKSINRQAISGAFDLFGLSLIDKVSSKSGIRNVSEIRDALGYSYGQGYGFDFGSEYTLKHGVSTLNVAMSVMDFGNTHYNLVSGTTKIDDQKMVVNTGVAWKQEFLFLDYTLSMDIHPLLEISDFRRKLHFGAEIALPFVSLLAGWNGGYLSYGASVKFWPVSVYAGIYGIEIGSEYGQSEGKRAVIFLSILDFKFDV
jgi:hypothetical protein